MTYRKKVPDGQLIASSLGGQMPILDVNAPVSSAPSDRLALGVSSVRPGVAGIGGTLNPSGASVEHYPLSPCCTCFEGNEE